MDIRKEIGGAAEKFLNKLADENLKGLGKDMLKEQAYKLIDKLIDDNYDKLFNGLYEKAKILIDKIDGEVDNVPAAPATPAPTV